MKCPGCGKEIDESRFPSGLAYCPYCGQGLKASEAREQVLFCPYCGQKLLDQSNFCSHCGKRLVLAEKGSARLKVVKDFVAQTLRPIAKAIRNPFSRKRKTRKLYQQWAEYAQLPPEEIPPLDTTGQMSTEEETEKEDSDSSESSAGSS